MPSRLTPAEVIRNATAGTSHRNRLLVSTLRLLRVLRVGRWRVEDMADELQMHKRAVYRILNSIEGAGIAIDRQMEGPVAYYRITSAALAKAFGLTVAAGHTVQRTLTVGVVTKSTAQWAREIGITQSALQQRIDLGWPPDVAVTTPAMATGRPRIREEK